LFCQWDVLDTQYYKVFRTLSWWTRSFLAPFSFRVSVSLSLFSSSPFLCTLPFSFHLSVAPSVSHLLSRALYHSLEHPLSPSLVFVCALVLALALFRYCTPWRSLTLSLWLAGPRGKTGVTVTVTPVSPPRSHGDSRLRQHIIPWEHLSSMSTISPFRSTLLRSLAFLLLAPDKHKHIRTQSHIVQVRIGCTLSVRVFEKIIIDMCRAQR